MHRPAPILLLSALLLVSCAAVDTPEACRLTRVAAVPIRMAGAIPLLEVAINGRPAQLMLDTGADGTVVSAEAFHRLGLDLDFARTAYVTGLGAQMVNWLSKPAAIKLGELALAPEPLPVTSFAWAMAPSDRPDGLLGGSVLASFDLDVDEPGGMLTLYEKRRCPGGAAPFEGVTIPAQGLGAVKLTIPITLDGRELAAEVDTGASRSLMDTARAGLSDSALAADRAGRVASADPVGARVHVHRFGRLQVGTDVVDEPIFWVGALRHDGADALLGSDFWRTRRLWVSYGSRTVTIGPAQPRPR